MLTCFKQELTQSDLLFETILLVANHRAIFEEQGWKPEDQVMAVVQSGVVGRLALGRCQWRYRDEDMTEGDLAVNLWHL